MTERLCLTLPDSDHAALAARLPQETLTLLQAGDSLLSRPVVAALDYVSEYWARDRDLPFADEIRRIAAQTGRRGAWFASLNYEWGCSAGFLPDAAGGPMLVRVLDWPFPRLGEMAVVANCQSPAGPWTNITWPGCVGALQANAPGRFAVAINQAPRRSFGLGPVFGLAAGWLYSKYKWWPNRGLPPALLLRQVCEQARDYNTALALLTQTPVAKPVIFTLAGLMPDEYAIIQRSYDGAIVRHERAISNCWLDPHLPGDLGPNDPPKRRARLMETLAKGDQFRWLQPPVLNQDSRLAVEMSPKSGLVRLQGWAGSLPSTEIWSQT